ncbi:uncharacterized protein METZ01_LOCUS247380 [marine metagenome]|jgi:hypothetical protein|uniref:Uncharacterized protein n=1 Tax=marine metagenome TaxID=408172 RepID=A0A382I4J8_9ZZZZ
MRNVLITLLVIGGVVMYLNDLTPAEFVNKYVTPAYEALTDRDIYPTR